jgi:tRNA(fMet)-specific endonuclease VapC
MEIATKRFRAAEEMLDGFELLYPHAASCRHFETLAQPKKGKKMGRPDMVIASIALAHDAVLVTRNLKDYEGIAGLHVENWAD